MGFDLYTLIFLALAVFIFFRLRSVLGQRTGNERPPMDRFRRETSEETPPPPESGKVIPLPARAPEERPPVESGPAEFRWKGVAEEGSELAAGLDAILAADPGFDPKVFTTGAKAAYEMIVNAFNAGDRKTLKNLLSREVYDSFVQAVGEREGRGEAVQSSFVSLDRADITAASMKGRVAHVTVRFASQMISATKDRGGAVVDGSLDKITEVTDLWTFARDTGVNDPNWRLVATEDA
ncbi:Tim44/TimA family putative adaptor protein [Labrys wisconsinensis]|uniref:Lipid-binding transport protein (Tim44 family) n=1 Tax=Labrys wisconsinensis TaxID=425677 RepID=A0ABU0JE18_9HYPH|nr:Tim44/TimA family putative adaptor protein [Labrys wisconsinensis]MDQ0472527.1 putative lipid-binding transport protein (Tim44 family) [Labrys wisconsinensis]